MRKETYHPIETPIGILQGRDAIYLTDLQYDGRRLTLEGAFNGHLATDTREEDLEYTISFVEVLAFRVLELDSWFHCAYMRVPMESSLWEVKDSAWQAQLGGKVTPEHRHFGVQTYDDVIDVVCREMEIAVRVPDF